MSGAARRDVVELLTDGPGAEAPERPLGRADVSPQGVGFGFADGGPLLRGSVEGGSECRKGPGRGPALASCPCRVGCGTTGLVEGVSRAVVGRSSLPGPGAGPSAGTGEEIIEVVVQFDQAALGLGRGSWRRCRVPGRRPRRERGLGRTPSRRGHFSIYFPLMPMGSSMGTMIDHPFGPAVPEVPLTRAPLALVVAQLRFPTVASIAEGETFIAPFQERLRAEYPVLRHEQQTQLLLGPEGPIQQSTGRIWKFAQAKGPWSITLAPDFLALSTPSYTSRAEFFERFETATRALEDWLTPPICDRLGVRYVDRVDEPALLRKLHELLRPEVLGVSGVKPGDKKVTERHSLADATFAHTDGSEIHARWGLLPAQATFDPTFTASETPSWVLDIDTYSTSPADFAATELTARARLFAERTYRFFRWAVTDAFLDAYGAQR